ncbi:MAG TPA: hypothetical protein VF576_08900 [Rubricoccaceae bacterium]
MDRLLRDLLPTSPDLGLYVAPDVPAKKLAAAVADYGTGVRPSDVLALYDATRLGSAKDGALFLADRVVFQNNDLSAARTVRYDDLVGVRQTRSFLGGRGVEMDLNRARATVTETLDFSAHPAAAEYVERFLQEAMLHASRPDGATEPAAPSGGPVTDVGAVEAALDGLVRDGHLTSQDRRRMLGALRG